MALQKKWLGEAEGYFIDAEFIQKSPARRAALVKEVRAAANIGDGPRFSEQRQKLYAELLPYLENHGVNPPDDANSSLAKLHPILNDIPKGSASNAIPALLIWLWRGHRDRARTLYEETGLTSTFGISSRPPVFPPVAEANASDEKDEDSTAQRPQPGAAGFQSRVKWRWIAPLAVLAVALAIYGGFQYFTRIEFRDIGGVEATSVKEFVADQPTSDQIQQAIAKATTFAAPQFQHYYVDRCAILSTNPTQEPGQMFLRVPIRMFRRDFSTPEIAAALQASLKKLRAKKDLAFNLILIGANACQDTLLISHKAVDANQLDLHNIVSEIEEFQDGREYEDFIVVDRNHIWVKRRVILVTNGLSME